MGLSFDVVNPNAAVTVALQGLAVCCHNKSFNGGRGRWEIAIPRFPDHRLTVKLPGTGTLILGRDFRSIEIKDSVGVATEPTFEIGENFSPKNLDTNHKNDFRWVTDFTNSDELLHTSVNAITIEENPRRVPFTMLYVHDAMLYTKNLDSGEVFRGSQEETTRINDNKAEILPLETVVPILSKAKDFFFEARTLGMDIQSGFGGQVEVIFDQTLKRTIAPENEPREIIICNLEPDDAPNADRFVTTDEFEFGLGDFYKYYQLFDVKGPQLHQWGRQSVNTPSGPSRSCCCNMVRASLPNLDAFAR